MVAEGVKSTAGGARARGASGRRDADRRAGRRGALRGPDAGRDRARADAAPGEARARAGCGDGVTLIVGALGGDGRARRRRTRRDHRGRRGWTLDWWIGADDRWRVPAREPAVRQQRGRGRAGGRDARCGSRAATRSSASTASAARAAIVIVEIENDSPGAFIVAFAVTGARRRSRSTARRSMSTGAPRWCCRSRRARWDVDRRRARRRAVRRADRAVIEPRELAPGTLRVALLYPLSHRNRMRIAVVICGDEPARSTSRSAPARPRRRDGWRTASRRTAMRVVGPDRAASADARPRPRRRCCSIPIPTRSTTAALEDWGSRRPRPRGRGRACRVAARRAARRRRTVPSTIDARRAAWSRARAGLVRDDDAGIELAPRAAGAAGQDLEVHDAPTASRPRSRSRCAGTASTPRCCGSSPTPAPDRRAARARARPGLVHDRARRRDPPPPDRRPRASRTRRDCTVPTPEPVRGVGAESGQGSRRRVAMPAARELELALEPLDRAGRAGRRASRSPAPRRARSRPSARRRRVVDAARRARPARGAPRRSPRPSTRSGRPVERTVARARRRRGRARAGRGRRRRGRAGPASSQSPWWASTAYSTATSPGAAGPSSGSSGPAGFGRSSISERER